MRQPCPDLDQPLAEQVDAAAEIPLGGAHGNTDEGAEEGQCQAEKHGKTKPVDDAGRDVAPDVVGAQQMAHRRRLRHRALGIQVDRLEAELDGREHPPAVSVLDQILHEGLEVLRFGLEYAAELRFRVFEQDREIEFALVAHHQRSIVRDELGEHAQHHHAGDDPQAPVAALVGLEVLPPAPREGRQPKPVARPDRTVRLRRHQARGHLCFPRFEIYAGIDERVGDVADKLHHEADEGEAEQCPEHDGIVAPQRCLETEQSQAIERKDHFDQ